MAKRVRVNLRDIFVGLQRNMLAEYRSHEKTIRHPVAKGDVREGQWLGMLDQYLPQRYQVANAFVIDSRGALSEQIDVVIYDQQYCPFLFNEGGTRYVPAESVYAVFEVKPKVTAANVRYAGKKVASVRRLRRTTAPIPHAGGVFKPKKSPRILGGLLCAESEWKTVAERRLPGVLWSLRKDERLDLGCILGVCGYDVRYTTRTARIKSSGPDTALMSFFLKLLMRLQASGTVAALDYNEYAKSL